MSGTLPPNDDMPDDGMDAEAGEGATPDVSPEGNEVPKIRRELGKIDPAREALLNQIQDDVRRSRAYWGPVYDRMCDNMDFVMGVQWPNSSLWRRNDEYTCNVCVRHVQELTATLYAKNPTVKITRRKRLLNTVWDGTFQSLQRAVQALMANPMDPMAAAVLDDAQQVKKTEELLRRMGETLEIVYNYNVEEQQLNVKAQMKRMVRAAIITGIGYVKLGFQRTTTRSPNASRAVGDMRMRMDTAARQVLDYADGEIEPNSAGEADMDLTVKGLTEEKEIVLREGLTFDYPDSNMIIPDTRCKDIATFAGCRRVTEQFMLSIAEIEEIYGVDVSCGYTGYKQVSGGTRATQSGGTPASEDAGLQAYVAASMRGRMSGSADDDRDQDLCCVWETYDARTGLIYPTCDGYRDFLRDPAPPDVKTDRFWPWFTYALNQVYHTGTPFPLADIDLMRDMQLDINRAKQGLREHRHAARPKTITSAGALDDEDKAKLINHPANAIIELNGLVPGQDVQKLLFPWQGPGIDPNLYETKTTYDDILRVIGVQEANLGGTSGATATESSIAESSRGSSADATMDDMNTMLSTIARVGSQILLLNVSTEIAQQIAGPGAVWPQASALEVAEEIYLEVEAGSSGRPNQAREVQVMTQLAPILMQIPGINPEWVARQMLMRLDDKADMDEALAANVPSISAMNAMMQGAGGPTGAPGAPNPANAVGKPGMQGGEGANNTEKPGANSGQPGAHPPPETGPPTPTGGMGMPPGGPTIN